MNSKEYLLNEAERLYVYNYNSIDEIAMKLNLSTKTISRWKEKHNWEMKKKSYLKSKQCFHEELYEFARKLMKDITSDMEAGEKIDPGRMYAFCRVIPMFTKVKDYEDGVVKKEKPVIPKGLSADTVRKIEEEVLGIIQDDINEPQDEDEE